MWDGSGRKGTSRISAKGSVDLRTTATDILNVPFSALVLGDWWTNADGLTDGSGAYDLRAFLGDYDLTVTYNGQEFARNFALGQGSGAITVVVPEPAGLGMLSLLICTCLRRRRV